MLLRERQRSVPKMFAGTAVKISTTLDDVATSVTVTIFDPTLGKVVSAAPMTNTSTLVWDYVWQSPDNAVEGDYVVDIYIYKGIYKSVDEAKFVLIQQEGLVNH